MSESIHTVTVFISIRLDVTTVEAFIVVTQENPTETDIYVNHRATITKENRHTTPSNNNKEIFSILCKNIDKEEENFYR